MKVTTTRLTQLTLTDAPGLDPIRVLIEDYELGKGRITISCWDAAWTAYWGAMSGRTLAEFFIECDPGYLAGNLGTASSLRRGEHHRAYLVRIITAVQQALRQSLPRASATRRERLERLGHANALIRLISQHGRRFFWNATAQRIARLELDERSKVWFVDDYSGKRIYTHEAPGGLAHRWQGFSHGGTLRGLVELMRDYVLTGQRLGIWRLATPGLDRTDYDHWGYGPEAAQALRQAAAILPIIDPA